MTVFVPAYDAENAGGLQNGFDVPSCLEACHRIVQAHRAARMPATFFIVTRLLDDHADEFAALLDDPLFEVASHTHTHALFCDHPLIGPAAPRAEVIQEIHHSKARIEQVFGRPCRGLRTPVGFTDGLQGQTEILAALRDAGYTYVSSRLWGQDYSLPAPLTQSYTYAEDGIPDLREFPGHGWHENLVKGNNKIFGMGALRVLLFPQPFPEAVPPGYVTTPEEEFAYNSRPFLDRARAEDLPYVSLIWHPWSLAMSDPDMRMLRLTLDHAREQGMPGLTFSGLQDRLTV